MGARFGHEILEAMSWARRQKKPVKMVVPTFGGVRFIAYIEVYGEDAHDVDRGPDLQSKLPPFYAYLTQSCSIQR